KAELAVHKPKDGSKTWAPSAMQNDIIKMVKKLVDRDSLAKVFPEFFGCILMYRFDDNSPIVPHFVDAHKQVTLISFDRLNEHLSGWYRLLFDTRYEHKTINLQMQAATTRG